MRATTLLFQKTNFALSDLALPASWIVPAAAGQVGNPGRLVATGLPSTLPIWDLRRFSEVHFYTWCGGYTAGAGSTFFGPRVYGYDQLTPHPGDYVTTFQSDGASLITSAGGTTTSGSIIVMTNKVPSIGNQVGANVPVAIMNLPLFAQFDLFYNGAVPTALTSLRVAIYGIS